ncbi:DUF4160 domain-containing protein [Desulfonema limicola]|uniref:DUF4160 domain-containing protein n=1 Tax=Desulfonema limicola TaxID=45656 RepID=UPI001A9B5072|nr:DUF4160 domain-containing protein [Desulfonema limicola]
MPVVFRYKDYRFFFYSNEGNPLEPVHVHVRKGESVAKFWLQPQISVVEAYGMKLTELRKLIKVIEKNKKIIEKTWNEYFNI